VGDAQALKFEGCRVYEAETDFGRLDAYSKATWTVIPAQTGQQNVAA
jgi:hypothetical protein